MKLLWLGIKATLGLSTQAYNPWLFGSVWDRLEYMRGKYPSMTLRDAVAAGLLTKNDCAIITRSYSK